MFYLSIHYMFQHIIINLLLINTKPGLRINWASGHHTLMAHISIKLINTHTFF